LENIGCSFCRLIRRREHLISRHWCLPANWRLFIRWSPDQWVSQCYAIECDRNFCCALFCVFMTRVSQCPISLRAKHPLKCHYSRRRIWKVKFSSSALKTGTTFLWNTVNFYRTTRRYITECCMGVCVYRQDLDWWMDLLSTCTQLGTTNNYSFVAISIIHISPQHPLSLLAACSVFTGRSLATGSNSGDSSALRSGPLFRSLHRLPQRTHSQLSKHWHWNLLTKCSYGTLNNNT
jgi:hypothetical protein